MESLEDMLYEIDNVSNIVRIEDEYYVNGCNLSQVCDCFVEYECNKFHVIIGIKSDFPLSNPIIFWKDYKEHFYPHIEETNGKICYIEEGYIFDYTNLTGVISTCINMAVKQIFNGMNHLNDDDFVKEFESYWNRIDNSKEVHSFINLDNDIKKIKMYSFREKFIVYENRVDYEFIANRNNVQIDNKMIQEGIYIALDDNKDIMPPKHDEMWSINKIRTIINKNLSVKKRKKLNVILKEMEKERKILNTIIISFPKDKNNIGILGVFCYNFAKSKRDFWLHPLRSPFFNCDLVPLSVKREDKNYLLNRGGALDSILNKRIVILGCGSLGGNIIEQLLNIGISKITIVDKDIFKVENVYRHILGYDSVHEDGTYKADEMYNYLKNKYKNIEIDAISYDLIDTIETRRIELDDFDLVIVAIGEPNIEFYLNKKIHNLKKQIPAIYTWIEPYGIGGHVLVTNNTKYGCYDCLYYDNYTGERSLQNKASLIMSGQQYTRKVEGCGSAYIPYSSLDAIQTAILCTRECIKVLLGQEKDNPLLTWKGENLYNVRTSKRYELSNEQLKETRYLYKSENCNICSKGEKVEV